MQFKRLSRVAITAFALAVLLAASSLAAYTVSVNGTVEGLEDGVDYTAAQYDFANNTYGEFGTLTSDTPLTAGVWGIKAGDSDPVEIFVLADETGLISADVDGETTDVYVAGKWTRSSDGAFSHIESTESSVLMYLDKASVLAPVTEGTWTGATALEGEANKLQESEYWYGFTNAQVFPASIYETYSSDLVVANVGALALNDGYSEADFEPLVTFYTKTVGSDVVNEYAVKAVYDVENGNITVDKPEDMPDDEYVVALGFAPYDELPDDFFVNNGDNADDIGYYHHYQSSEDNGVTLVIAEEADLIPEEDSVMLLSANNDVMLTANELPAIAAPTNLTYDEDTGVVEGLDPDTDYYYAPYTVNGAGEKQYVEDGAETLELSVGLWGVGIVSNDSEYTDSLPYIVYVRGFESDREELGVIGDDSKPAFGYTTSTTGPDWNVGKWIVTGDQWSACTLYDTDGYYVFNDTSSGVSNTTYKPTTLYSYQETLKTNPDDADTAAALLALQTEMAEKMSTRHISYAYDATEIIPVNELLSASFAVRFVQGGLSFKKVNSKLAVYVMDSNGVVTPYEWTSEQWSAAAYHGVKKHTVNVQSITNLPDEGWVVGIAFYPYAVVEPYSIVAAENNDTQRQTRIGFYYNDYTIYKAPIAAPTGIAFNEETGLVEGFDKDTTYYYAPYTIKGAGDAQTVTGVETLDLTAGLWGIGIKSSDADREDSPACLVYVRGSESDREELGVIGDDSKPAFSYTASTTSPDWNVGKWIVTGDQWSACTLYDTDGYYVFNDTSSGVSNTTYKPTTLYSYQETLKTNPNDTATAAALLELQTEMAEKMSTRHISYAYDGTEIIPVNELLSASFAVRFVQGGLSFKKVNSKLAVYVMDSNGVVTPYEWTSEQWSAAAYHGVKKHTVNVQSITNLPDEGWVVGIAFYPYAVVEPSSIVAAENNDTQRQTRIGFYYNDYTIYKAPIAAPTGIAFNEETGLVEGFDKDTTYYYAPYTIKGAGDAQTVTGVETLDLTAGLWGIGIKSSDADREDSPACLVYVRGSESDREELGVIGDDSKPAFSYTASTTSPDWNVGKWIVTGDQWSGCSLNKPTDTITFSDTGLGIPSATYKPTTLWGYQETLKTNPDDTVTAAAQLELQTQIATQIAKRYIAYAYDATEIIPVDELLKMSFVVTEKQGSLAFKKAKSKLAVYVMDSNGDVVPYEWTSAEWASVQYHSQKLTADVQSIENLPDEGWVVGIAFYPYADVEPSSIEAFVNADTQNQDWIGYYPAEYSIVKAAPAPEISITTLNQVITVSNYNEQLQYAYSADGGLTWTAFTGNSFIATEANTAYIVKSLKGGAYTESAASNEVISAPLTLVGTSLVLDGQIGLKVYLDIDPTLADSVSFYTTKRNSDYTSGEEGYTQGGSVTLERGNDWMTQIQYDEESGYCYTIIYVPAKDIDNISFETDLGYSFGENARVQISNKSIDFMSYIAQAKSLAAAGNEAFEKALPLVEALETYTAYADNYFNGGQDAAYASTALPNANIEAATRTNTDPAGLEFYGTSLILKDQVTIRHYFTVKDMTAFTEAGYTCNIPYTAKGNYIYFDITDISAQFMNDAQTLTITQGETTVYENTYRVTNYIWDQMKNSDANLVSLVNAMYDYYLEAVEYAK